MMERKLFIIDDNPEIIDVVTEILKDQFDEIISATSVEEAEIKLNQDVFSFIILDIRLASRNGAEVLKHLIDNPENENNKRRVLILSGVVTPEFAIKFSSRFAGVLMKPFEHDELLSIIQSAFFAKNSEDDTPDNIPEAPCVLPFTSPELQHKVSKILDVMKKNAKIKQLFTELSIDRTADNYVMTHIGMLINISTAICMKLDWSNEKTLEKFVYASYLHDMSVSHRSDLCQVHGSLFEVELLKDKLSINEMKLIMDHPITAANKVASLSEIPNDVEIIIRHHHELPKGNGWPGKITHSKITPLTTVFIVSHDLVDYILTNPNWILKEFIAKAKTKFKGQHFAKVLFALNEMD